MESRMIGAIYITLFLILSVVLYVVIIPSKKEYTEYRKSRHIMATALMLASLIGFLRLVFPPANEWRHAQSCITLMLSYAFTCLNYISFMYMIETSRPTRKRVKKVSFIILAPVLILGFGGILFHHYSMVLTIMLTVLCLMMNIYLFNSSIREYDKFILQMSNYYDNNLDIRWIPGMLWATFLIAMVMCGAIFYPHLYLVSGSASLFVFPYISIKLLSFIPANIHVVRVKVREHEILAQEHVNEDINHIQETVSGGVFHTPALEEIKTEAKENKDYKRLEKVGLLMEKWTLMEHYTQPDINIKDVATEMGTNSNYLSTYINRILETSFATWLNTLRVEKSKEYLCGKERLSIEECGIRVGYQSLYNYSRWFKSVTGMSPSEWRRNQCNN